MTAEFALEPLAIGRRASAAAAPMRRASPSIASRAQVCRRVGAVRHRERRQEDAALGERQRAAARDLDAVLERLRQVAEQRGHLGRRLEVLLGRVRARPAGVVEPVAAMDADARLVRLEFVARQEAHVVGRDDRRRPLRDQRKRRPRCAPPRLAGRRAAPRGSSGRRTGPASSRAAPRASLVAARQQRPPDVALRPRPTARRVPRSLSASSQSRASSGRPRPWPSR